MILFLGGTWPVFMNNQVKEIFSAITRFQDVFLSGTDGNIVHTKVFYPTLFFLLSPLFPGNKNIMIQHIKVIKSDFKGK